MLFVHAANTDMEAGLLLVGPPRTFPGFSGCILLAFTEVTSVRDKALYLVSPCGLHDLQPA